MVVSCIVEMFAEAPTFVAQVFCFVKLRVVLDTLQILVRSVIFVWLVIRDPGQAIFAFSIAQIGSTIVFVIGYYAYFSYYLNWANKQRAAEKRANDQIDYDQQQTHKHSEDFIPLYSIREMLPGALHNPVRMLPNQTIVRCISYIFLLMIHLKQGTLFDENLQTLMWSFFKQGILKHVLTEGEKYVMSISPILTFPQQATYDIVNNLGSLAARFVFRPIEENSYFYFTQTILRDDKLAKQPRAKVEQASSVLYNLLKVVTSIGLIGLVFGQSFAKTVLTLYGGAKFVGEDGLAVLLLRWHAVAIVLLAINGICEGYMFATMTSRDLDK